MTAEILHVVACVANPFRWRSRIALAPAAINEGLRAPEIAVTLVECAYGARGFALADLAGERVSHVGVRATTMAWTKENLLNIAIARLPAGAEKIATRDADVKFRGAGWARETLAALDLYPVVQPWDAAYDLGPHDEHIQTHRSFASIFHAGGPVVPAGDRFWSFNGGPYEYPHSGYAWAWTRGALDRIGGLFELGGMAPATITWLWAWSARLTPRCRAASAPPIAPPRRSGSRARSRKSTAGSGWCTARSSTRSPAARPAAATSRAGRCS